MGSDNEVNSRRATGSVRDRRADREAGQALPEFVGVVGLLLLVVAIVFVAATPVAADVSEQLLCAVDPIVKEEGADDCADSGGGSGEPGGGESPGDGFSRPSGDCQEDVTVELVGYDDPDVLASLVQIDCVWYPNVAACMMLFVPGSFPDQYVGEGVYLEEEVRNFVACVLGGKGDPKDDPNDTSCATATPTSGEIDEDAPPKVQVGCRVWPVPKGCEEEWAAYKDAPVGKERAARSGALANCISDVYDSIEFYCIVQATAHVDSTQMQFLFFRWGESNGTLIEKLGDGRIRIHILTGVELGAGLSGSEVGGSPVSFDVAGITGYGTDKTYEFTDMQKAQDWIDWYKQYDAVNNKSASCSGAAIQWRGYCDNPNIDRAEELRDEEPPHHELAEANSEIKKVTLKGGLKGGRSKGFISLKGSFEGGYEGEVQVEDRRWSDGSRSASYTSSNIAGFLVGAELSGNQPFTKNKNGKDSSSGKVKGKAQGGKEWTGTTSTSVFWNPDGELSRLVIAMDDQVMETLYKAGVELDVVLPYGFKLRGGYTTDEQEGTISKTEMIIDFNQYPELRKTLGPTIDKIFPRDDDGDLIKGDVELYGSNAGNGGAVLYEAAKDYANVRRLTYDANKVTKTGSGGLTWQGLDLFKATFTEVDEERTLKESKFDVTDVDGNKQTMSPAPKCKDEDFVEPPAYYSDDFSDPSTSSGGQRHDLGAEYVSNKTPKFTEGTYPGTDYDGEPDWDKLTSSLVAEYSEDFPDKNIIVVKHFDKFSFSNLFGFVHLATVGEKDVIALNSGKVHNKGDGGWDNWGFTGNYDYDPGRMTVVFKQR